MPERNPRLGNLLHRIRFRHAPDWWRCDRIAFSPEADTMVSGGRHEWCSRCDPYHWDDRVLHAGNWMKAVRRDT